MKVTLRLVVLVLTAALTAPAALGAPVLKNGDRWPVSSPQAVAVDAVNHLVFMARGNVLTVLSDALAVQGRLDLDAEIRCISYSDDLVFAAVGSDGLVLVDVTDPTDPQKRSTFSPTDGSSVASVFASGGYACITNIGNRFKVLNVANPSAPTEIGAETLSGLLVSAVNVHVSGNVAAVVDQVNGLHLLNVADKSNPQWQSVTAIAGAFDVRLDGSYAYVASIAGGLDIVDISDIADPQQQGSYTPVDGYSVGVFVNGNTAWLADQVNGLHEITIADKDNPILSSTIAGTIGAYSVATDDGTNVYVCDHERGIQRVAGGAVSYEAPCEAINLCVDDDDYLYVVSSSVGGNAANEGLRILDAYNPGNIGYESYVATAGQATSVFVSGTHAYVTDSVSDLLIMDVSDPSNPGVPVIYHPTVGTPVHVAASNSLAYLAKGAAGLEIVDVSNPAAPLQDGLFATAGNAAHVVVSGGYAYVSEGAGGLEIVNLSTLAQEDVFNTAGAAVSAVVSGNYAYIAEGAGGIEIVNIADKSNPVLVGSYNTAGNANNLAVSGQRLYIADGTNGLVTVDVSDPANPSIINAWSTGTTADAVNLHVVGGYVYVAEGLGGAAVYRLTDEEPFVPTQSSGSGGGGGCFIASLGL